MFWSIYSLGGEFRRTRSTTRILHHAVWSWVKARSLVPDYGTPSNISSTDTVNRNSSFYQPTSEKIPSTSTFLASMCVLLYGFVWTKIEYGKAALLNFFGSIFRLFLPVLFGRSHKKIFFGVPIEKTYRDWKREREWDTQLYTSQVSFAIQWSLSIAMSPTSSSSSSPSKNGPPSYRRNMASMASPPSPPPTIAGAYMQHVVASRNGSNESRRVVSQPNALHDVYARSSRSGNDLEFVLQILDEVMEILDEGNRHGHRDEDEDDDFTMYTCQ